MKFSCCIDMMYATLPLTERIGMAAQDGADAIEFWKWSNKDITAMKEALSRHSMRACLCNLDVREEALSYELSRGILSHRKATELIRAIHESAPVMRQLGITKAIVLAGDADAEIEYERALDNIHATLLAGVKAAEEEGVELILEPLNTYDRPGYVLPYSAPAFAIVRDIGSPALKILLDLYHTQRMEGNLIHTLQTNIGHIGHFHVANSPKRCEPDCGEIDYRQVLCAIDESGYTDYVGFEYRQLHAEFSLKQYITERRNQV